MKSTHNSAALNIKLLFATVLMAIIGFAFVSQYSAPPSLGDSSHQVAISEAQESWGSSESVIPDDSPLDVIPFTNVLLICVSIYLTTFNFRNKVSPRLTFLYHIRPRSPPQF
jgi:hypothetical protein